MSDCIHKVFQDSIIYSVTHLIFNAYIYKDLYGKYKNLSLVSKRFTCTIALLIFN